MQKASAGRWAALLTALFVSGAQAQDVAGRLKACAGCHGADGNSRTAGVPSLAAQPRVFLENYLVLTREGVAGTDVMRQLLKGVPDKELAAIAAHYSGLPSKFIEKNIENKTFERGKQVAANNRCGSCHLPDFRGREQMPRLAGQREEYLAAAMLAYRENRRPGGDTLMAAALYGIPEADLKALAHYLSRLK